MHGHAGVSHATRSREREPCPTLAWACFTHRRKSRTLPRICNRKFDQPLRKKGQAMNRKIALIGVPSSAGAHWPGQEKAPQCLREAGLVARLAGVGLDVHDCGDLPLVRFRPDPDHRHCQNLPAVVEVCRRVADQVDSALQRGAVPLVIGGDCTIGLGVVAGYVRHHADLSVLYFDGHVDLNTPATSPTGILDSMGVAHMIAEEGAADELSHIGERFPLMPADGVVLFGCNPRETNAGEREAVAQHRLLQFPIDDVRGRAAQAATEALDYLEGRSKRFVVHFDVDAIDFTDFPIANVPQFSEGLTFRDAMICLTTFAASPSFGGLTITEINPDHSDDERARAAAFIEGIALALVGEQPPDRM